jgi:Na+-driven multidrug efflux pump
MTAENGSNRHVRRTALLIVALVFALIFGIIVLAGGDWIPGTLIVVASVIALARQVPTIARLRRQAPPSPPHGTPSG